MVIFAFLIISILKIETLYFIPYHSIPVFGFVLFCFGSNINGGTLFVVFFGHGTGLIHLVQIALKKCVCVCIFVRFLSNFGYSLSKNIIFFSPQSTRFPSVPFSLTHTKNAGYQRIQVQVVVYWFNFPTSQPCHFFDGCNILFSVLNPIPHTHTQLQE